MIDELKHQPTTTKYNRGQGRVTAFDAGEQLTGDREESGEPVPSYVQEGTFGRRIQRNLETDRQRDGQGAARSRTGLASGFHHSISKNYYQRRSSN